MHSIQKCCLKNGFPVVSWLRLPPSSIELPILLDSRISSYIVPRESIESLSGKASRREAGQEQLLDGSVPNP